ncbi:MAG: hypothetical protein L0Z62_45985 [Gemmataceae bacterium]|nr:hypothetical protein [Gemmataceae bacterium]
MKPRFAIAAWFICLTCWTPTALSGGRGPAAPPPIKKAAAKPGAKKTDRKPIRVLVVQLSEGEGPAAARLRKLRFEVVALPWKQVDVERLKNVDVILLPTGWAGRTDSYEHLESKKDQFHGFINRGGGLLICQPNPLQPGTRTPRLLPYPITFQNQYDATDPERVNLDPAHFITDDLPGSDLPFPFDPMLEVDRRYTLLARQKSTGWASLAVCRFGDGRVVVQTANENPAASIRLGDEILRRMVVWAAGREPG